MLSISFKNYRCFGDDFSHPLPLDGGFVAIVGPNNSGKSAILRWLAAGAPTLYALALKSGNNRPNGTLMDPNVKDQRDLFCNRNSHDSFVRLQMEGGQELVYRHHRNGYLFTLHAVNGHELLPNTGNAMQSQTKRGVMPIGMDEDFLVLANGPFQPDRLIHMPTFSRASECLSQVLYIPATRSASMKGPGGEDYGVTYGRSLVAQWNQLSAGDNPDSFETTERVKKDIRTLLRWNDLQITPHADGSTLFFVTNGRRYNVLDIGSGVMQMTIAILSAAIRKPSLLLIDEPEMSLHPSMQIDFMMALSRYASHGTVFASHSIGLATSLTDRVFCTDQGPDGLSSLRPMNHSVSTAVALGESSITLQRALGYKTTLLVEGPSDVLVFKTWLRTLGLDRRTLVISLGGGSGINGKRDAHLREHLDQNSPVVAIIDSERRKPDEDLARDRSEFLSLCESIGIPSLATSVRATENYLSQAAIDKAFTGLSTLAPHEKLSDRTQDKRWAKNDSWKAAEYMTREEITATDAGAFILKHCSANPGS